MGPRIRPKNRRGFTLIELLIVIAIILILIAIALPNFLEAQIRAKVVRVEGDMRTLSIAMESYFLDRMDYPYVSVASLEYTHLSDGLRWLTSPVAYITSLPHDPFSVPSEPPVLLVTMGENYKLNSTTPVPMDGADRITQADAYILYSFGPNVEPDSHSLTGAWPASASENPCANPFLPVWTYSPTNGTRSVGDVLRVGGEYRAGNWCLDGIIIRGR